MVGIALPSNLHLLQVRSLGVSMRLILVFLSLWLITSTLFFFCNRPFANTGDVEVDRILDYVTASTMAILPIILGLAVLLFVRKTKPLARYSYLTSSVGMFSGFIAFGAAQSLPQEQLASAFTAGLVCYVLYGLVFLLGYVSAKRKSDRLHDVTDTFAEPQQRSGYWK